MGRGTGDPKKGQDRKNIRYSLKWQGRDVGGKKKPHTKPDKLRESLIGRPYRFRGQT